jgi:hypothetical protein
MATPVLSRLLLAPNSHSRVLAILLGGIICACSEPDGVDGCFGDVDVSVVRTNPPSFSWLPVCGISNLAVVDGGVQSLWLIHGTVGENRIGPPITFGVVPDKTDQSVPPGQLQHGNVYIVRVFRLRPDGLGGFQLIKAGEQNFPW